MRIQIGQFVRDFTAAEAREMQKRIMQAAEVRLGVAGQPFYQITAGERAMFDALLSRFAQEAEMVEVRQPPSGSVDPLRLIYVNVELPERKYEWRTVRAETLETAIELAQQMPDVIAVLEASFIPGGVAT